MKVVGEDLNIRYNSRNIRTQMVGDLKGYGTVWSHEKVITNILFLCRVTGTFHVQSDIRSNDKFMVCYDDGSARYFCDMSRAEGILLANYGTIYDLQMDNDPAHISTVTNNLMNFAPCHDRCSYL